MCGVMWHVSQMDIENTLTKACYKVMRDHSVTDDIRHRRALGLKVSECYQWIVKVNAISG